MQAKVLMLSEPVGIGELVYGVPDALVSTLRRGHRVLVPLRSRKRTGIVIGTAEQFEPIGSEIRPILELLEGQPILDDAHLQLLEFMASYYLVSLGEAARSVIPGAFRIETRQFLALAGEPNPLTAAVLGPAEKALVEKLAKHPMTPRQVDRMLGEEIAGRAVAALDSHGLIERRDGIRGRHREPMRAAFATLAQGAAVGKLRGPRQQEIAETLRTAGTASVAEIEARAPGAKVALRAMIKRGIVQLVEPTGMAEHKTTATAPELSVEQAQARDAIAPAIVERRSETFLLWGVTASGKTELYLQLTAKALGQNRQTLILAPEIALTSQVVRAFRERFGAQVAVAHSGQKPAERWASWMAALSGQARIMVGPRSVIFAPIHNLGLIVVDEEHDPAYKQEEGLRYQARDLAVALGRFSDCPVVLGSATPSAESFANARNGRYRLVRLTRRILGRPMAQVEIADLRRDNRVGNKSGCSDDEGCGGQAARAAGLSAVLATALRENHEAGGQSLVFINRRGYHNFLQCHLCGNVISCDNCSVSMTFHMGDRSLRCHYCGARSASPDSCPACRGFGLEGQGFGTERLAAALNAILPDARVERMDSDTSLRGGTRSRIIEALRSGEIDILVGTQMIAKGLDFPGVTLVGVVLADLALNMPDFRSAERTFQLLTQVAGRAGRGERPGRVLIQTYAPHHYSIRAAFDQDYARFIRRELQLRREFQYPPYVRLALVRLEGTDANRIEEIGRRSARVLEQFAEPAKLRVLGPAPAPIERIKQRFRWQVMVKAARLADIHRALKTMRREVAAAARTHEVRLAIDIDPVSML